MIAAADLPVAQRQVDSRAADLRMRERLLAAEPLTLTVGSGATAGAIVLAPVYVARLRGDVLAALDRRIAEFDANLAAMGIEP